MRTPYRVILALVLIVLPVLARVLYFYQAPYLNSSVQKPDYASFNIPQPPTPSSLVKTVANPPSGKVVVIDNFHGNQFAADEIEPLVTAINAQGASVEVDNGSMPLDMELKYASAYVVFAPSVTFSSNELRVIQQFVANGGRLLAFSDPTHLLLSYDQLGNQVGTPDVNYINPLIASFGLTIVNDYLYNLESNEGNFRNVKFTSFAENPLTKDLKMVVFYGAHSIHADEGSLLAVGDEKTFSSLTDRGGALSPLALGANGQVLVVGDFSFITNPFNQVADNQLLLAHIADFATGGERNPALANFPFVFQHPVSLVTTGDVELTSDILEPLASLQRALQSINIPLNVRETSLKDGDTIVLGTFKPGSDLAAYLKPFNIDLTSQDLSLNLYGLGNVSKSGVGILLLNHGPKSNTLVLLADTAQDMPALITLVASGDLSACLLQDNIAICNLASSSGSGYDYFGGGSQGLPTELPTTTEATPTEVPLIPTPTPSG